MASIDPQTIKTRSDSVDDHIGVNIMKLQSVRILHKQIEYKYSWSFRSINKKIKKTWHDDDLWIWNFRSIFGVKVK